MQTTATKPVYKRSIGTYSKEEVDEMWDRTIKKITSSKEEALKFLKEAGILDENGELAEHYRSSDYEEKKRNGKY